MEKYFSKFLSINLPDGTKKQLRFRGKTEKEATEKMLRAKIEHEKGLLILNSKTLFNKWVDEWLEVYKKPKQGAHTYKMTKSIMQNVFVSEIGNMKIEEIKTSHLQKCLNKRSDKSQSNINKAYTAIKDCFDKAEINGLIQRNVIKGIEKPRGTKGQRRALTPAERQIFFKVVPKHNFGFFYAIMLGCGLRPGEVRALTWNEIQSDCIHVKSAIKKDTKEIGVPKSKAGIRIIPTPDWLQKIIATQQIRNVGFVFGGTAPISEKRLTKAWHSFHRLMDIEGGAKTYRNEVIVHSPIVGQDLTPYYLRHTYATNLAENGIDIKTAQYLLGHSDISMTAQIYTHVTPKMLDAAKEKIKNFPQ